MQVKPNEQMLLIEGKPIRSKKVRYYNDELFRVPVPN
jgi:hypothetical protein